jgi:hypothetical protein
MNRRLGPIALIFLAAFAFVLVNAAPSSFDLFGTTPAFAKKGGNGGNKGGSDRGGSKSNKGNKSKNKSASAGIGGNGKSSKAPGKTKQLVDATKLASAGPKTLGTKTPKSIVRQYALANGLKQGEIASLLKSWNSLNRNPQAYLNNMDNPNSLPGLQIAYIRGSIGATAALDAFTALGGDPLNPPTETDLLAAQDALAAQDVLDAQAVLDEFAADPLSHTAEDVAAAQAAVDGYTGGAPAAQTVVDAFAAGHTFDAATVIDQFNSWTTFQGTEATAQDAFMAASVSYKGEVYDEAVFGDLRRHVDAIVEMKGLDDLIADFDAAAGPTDPVEPTEPEESTDPTEPAIILPE